MVMVHWIYTDGCYMAFVVATPYPLPESKTTYFLGFNLPGDINISAACCTQGGKFVDHVSNPECCCHAL